VAPKNICERPPQIFKPAQRALSTNARNPAEMTIMKRTLKSPLIQLVIIVSTSLAVHGVNVQTINPVGRYVYKTHREGRGGFDSSLEITSAARGKFHISFEGTYFYMAGRDETFHEGAGEGDGQLNGNILTATLSDGAQGSCRLAMTFNLNRVTVKASPNCQLNVSPEGIYKKEIAESPGDIRNSSAVPPGAASKPKAFDVCPDPNSPCRSAMHAFAPYELPFRLPARSQKGKTYDSSPFYAIILRTYKDEECDADGYTKSIEQERRRLQKLYSTRKVFGSYSCPDMDAVEYSFPGKMDASGERVLIDTFIAVFAGNSPAEAKEFLTQVQTQFPKAPLKRMTASYEIIDQ
jgi:hypothetical protein